jgi:hypothetical protein
LKGLIRIKMGLDQSIPMYKSLQLLASRILKTICAKRFSFGKLVQTKPFRFEFLGVLMPDQHPFSLAEFMLFDYNMRHVKWTKLDFTALNLNFDLE